MSCINAGMGIISSIGLLTFTGYEFNQIVSVMPFLVLGMSVQGNSTFIVQASYLLQRSVWTICS